MKFPLNATDVLAQIQNKKDHFFIVFTSSEMVANSIRKSKINES